MPENNNKNDKEDISFSFDLKIDETAAKANPRIHQAPGESTCESCEG